MAGRALTGLPVVLCLILPLLLFQTGCGHTQPAVRRSALTRLQTSSKIGVEGVFDLHQFNYADIFRDEAQRTRSMADIVLTHNLADPQCDYVIRGNFVFYMISNPNAFYRASIYLLLLPVLTGLPAWRQDGLMTTHFEIYRRGTLIKTYSYQDVFWAQRSLWLPAMAPDVEDELRYVTRLFIRDVMKDLFASGNQS